MTVPDQPRESAAVPTSVAHIQNPSTILLVEDNDDDAELLRRMFRRARVLNPLRVVQSVGETLEYLEGRGIHSDRTKSPFPVLIFLDLKLPDGSGFDLLQWIESHRTNAPAAVVVLTGSDIKAIQRGYAMGAHSFLVKPLKFEDFENMVRNVRGIKLVSTREGHVVELAK